MLFEDLKAKALTLPATAGLRFRDTFYSYQDTVERVERAAAHLVAAGVEPGHRVAVFLPHSPDLYATCYAMFAIGVVAVPLSLVATARELAWAAESCAITAIVHHAETAAQADAFDPERRLTRLLADSSGMFAPIAPISLTPPAGDTDAVYLFSSGSTGRPKVVPHTHAEFRANGRQTSAGLRLTPDDVILNTLPGHHAFGFMNSHFEALAGGATVHFWSDPQPMMMARSRLLAALADRRVTVMPGVPLVYDMLAGTNDEVDLGHLRYLYSGGVGLRRPVFDRFKARFGIELRQGYGSTETAHLSLNMEPDGDATWNSVGRAVPGVSVEVVPHEDAPPGGGEIFVRSPSLTRGYLNAPPAAAASFHDGGYLTGDLGHIDDNGHIYVTGRAKLIIEVAGQKVDPIEVEDVLAGHPAVEEAVVVGVPSPRTGEQELKAVVVRLGDVDAKQLLALCRSSLSAYKVPNVVEFRDEIPRSGAGKVLRGKLLD